MPRIKHSFFLNTYLRFGSMNPNAWFDLIAISVSVSLLFFNYRHCTMSLTQILLVASTVPFWNGHPWKRVHCSSDGKIRIQKFLYDERCTTLRTLASLYQVTVCTLT